MTGWIYNFAFLMAFTLTPAHGAALGGLGTLIAAAVGVYLLRFRKRKESAEADVAEAQARSAEHKADLEITTGLGQIVEGYRAHIKEYTEIWARMAVCEQQAYESKQEARVAKLMVEQAIADADKAKAAERSCLEREEALRSEVKDQGGYIAKINEELLSLRSELDTVRANQEERLKREGSGPQNVRDLVTQADSDQAKSEGTK